MYYSKHNLKLKLYFSFTIDADYVRNKCEKLLKKKDLRKMLI
jgi:ATP-dependent protease HslVU (ClpYQ) ATPase subunit